MLSKKQRRRDRWLHRYTRGYGLMAVTGICAVVLVLQGRVAAVEKPVLSVQAQAGYAGQDACLECHDDVGEAFKKAVHGRAELPGWTAGRGCEACHGPAAKHAESGEPDDMMTFAEMDAGDANQRCLACHSSDAAMYWRGSEHETEDIRCTQCHSAHEPWSRDKALANRNVTANCISCHPKQQKGLYQRSSHPLRNGQMSCVDCHSPHGSPIEASVDAVRVNDKCYECHAEMRGPFLWDHIPVREDCMTCHNPHGSNQTKLLTQAPPRLCQSCHLFGHHQTVAGTDRQVWNSNRSCVNCHPRIHGSNHPSGVLFMR